MQGHWEAGGHWDGKDSRIGAAASLCSSGSSGRKLTRWPQVHVGVGPNLRLWAYREGRDQILGLSRVGVRDVLSRVHLRVPRAGLCLPVLCRLRGAEGRGRGCAFVLWGWGWGWGTFSRVRPGQEQVWPVSLCRGLAYSFSVLAGISAYRAGALGTRGRCPKAVDFSPPPCGSFRVGETTL